MLRIDPCLANYSQKLIWCKNTKNHTNVRMTQVSVSPGPGAAPEVFPDYYEEGAVAGDKKVKPHAQAHLLSATEHCKVRGELELETNKV